MKRDFQYVLLVSLLATTLLVPRGVAAAVGQLGIREGAALGRETSRYQTVDRGPNHKTWERVISETLPNGKTVTRKSSYVELATGMHYLKDGQWAESKELIEIVPDGGVARQGPHQVTFAANINTAGAIDLKTPDGKRFRTHVLGIAYTDGSGRSAMIAEIKDSIGEVVPPNVVIYRDAFTAFFADIRYTYTRAGFEQDIIFRQAPPSPVEYGLNPDTTRLEVFTEVLEWPGTKKTTRMLKQELVPARRQIMVEPDLMDDTLDFGAMQIGPGNGFPLETTEPLKDSTIPVGKSFEAREGRQFLIEKLDYRDIRPHLQSLPPAAALKPERKEALMALAAAAKKGVIARHFPRAPAPATAKKPLLMAQASPSERGYVLDYSLLNSATDFVFRGDTTYFVNGAVNLSGTTVIEGGTVVKYTNGASVARLVIQGPISCQTTNFRVAVFTAKDDDSVGEIVNGSTGQPTNYYASHAFSISDTASTYDLHDLRVCWANQAFYRGSGSPAITLSHSQIQDCNRAFGCYYSPVRLRNVLLHRIKVGYYGAAGNTNTGEHVTYHIVGTFSTGSLPPPCLTNCLIISVTNALNFTGANNVNSLSDNDIFQTVGGAAHYLAAGSPHRDAGTTSIDSTLAAQLTKRTTFPPLVYSNTVISVDTTFVPQATRDAGLPDLGYHYDSLDYAFGGVTANANVTFAPGTAVGWFRTSSGWYHAGHGLHMGDQKVVTFDGRVDQPAWWVRCSVVQEGASSLWAGGYGPGGITGWADQNAQDVTRSPEVLARFTRFSVLACDSAHFRDDWGYLIVRARDCEFWGGATAGYVISCYLTNCLLDRVYSGQIAGFPGNEIQLRNCTWRGGMFQLNRSFSAIPVSIRDCAFER